MLTQGCFNTLRLQQKAALMLESSLVEEALTRQLCLTGRAEGQVRSSVGKVLLGAVHHHE